MIDFLILGLPRSRTTWLSMLFTTGPAICHHDFTARSCDLDTFLAAPRGARKFVGVSDTFLPWYGEALNEPPFDKIPKLIVERPVEDVACSLMRMGLPDEAMGRLRERLDLVDGMRISAESLSIASACRSAFEHLLPSVKFNEERCETLIGYRIEPVSPFRFYGRHTENLAAHYAAIEEREKVAA